jgi:hypothetical protein
MPSGAMRRGGNSWRSPLWGLFYTAAASVLLLGCAESRAEEPRAVLWLSIADAPFSLLAQLHPGGYAWLRLTGGFAGKPPVHQVTVTVALRKSARTYEDLSTAVRQSGLGWRSMAECTDQVRIGVAPVVAVHSGPCNDNTRLVERFKEALFPGGQLLAAWQRIVSETRAIVDTDIMVAHRELEATLNTRSGASLVLAPGYRDPLVSDSLLEALGRVWGEEAVLVEYRADIRLEPASPVQLSFPTGSSLRINGQNVSSAQPVFKAPPTAPGVATFRADLGARSFRFQGELGDSAPAATVRIDTPLSLWFPRSLWTPGSRIEILYAHASQRVRLSLTGAADASLCANAACSSLSPEDARGLAAMAFGECRASVAARGTAKRPALEEGLSLAVRIGAERCALSLLKQHCLRERRPGLERVTQVLSQRTLTPEVSSRDAPAYPICEDQDATPQGHP